MKIFQPFGAVGKLITVAFLSLIIAVPVTSSANGLEKSDFVRIATEGIDNPQNNYAFSSSTLNGDAFIGTGRNFLFRIIDVFRVAGLLPPDYEYQIVTSPGGLPWSVERASDMSAEIWRYRDGILDKVYQSVPVDVSALGIPTAPPQDAYAAKEPGFRSMVTYTDKFGESAVYAANAAGAVPGKLLIKSTDGENWGEVATFPTIFQSDSRSIQTHNGKLYVGPAGLNLDGTTAGAKLWATDNPTTDPTTAGANWQLMADFTNEGPGQNVAVVSMVSWNGHLYAGTQNDDGGFQLWRSNARSPEDPKPGEWTRIIESGAGDLASTRALTMTLFKDALWVGTSMFPLSVNAPFILPPKGFELIRVDADDNWQLIIGDYIAQKPLGGTPVLRTPVSGWPGGFGNFLNIYCWSLWEYDDVLYLGTFDMTSFLYVLLQDPVVLSSTLEQLVPPGTLEAAINTIGGLEPSNIPEPYQQLLSVAGTLGSGATDWDQIWRTFLEQFAGADLWKSEDGLTWVPITLNGFDNQENYGWRTMFDMHTFFVGSANPFSGLDIFRAGNEIVGTAGGDILNGTEGIDIIKGGPRRDRITTGGGRDIIVYETLFDAGDIITDFEVGADRISLSMVLSSLGVTSSDPLGDGYVSVMVRYGSSIVAVDPDGTSGSARPRSFLLLQGVTDPLGADSFIL